MKTLKTAKYQKMVVWSLVVMFSFLIGFNVQLYMGCVIH